MTPPSRLVRWSLIYDVVLKTIKAVKQVGKSKTGNEVEVEALAVSLIRWQIKMALPVCNG